MLPGFILWIFLAACSGSPAKISLRENKTTVSLKPQSISGKAGSPERFVNASGFYQYDREKHTLIFYSETGAENGRSVLQFPDSLNPKSENAFTWCLNRDSVFALIAESKMVFQFGSNGELKNFFPVTANLSDGTSDYVLFASPQSPFAFDGKNLFVTATRMDMIVRTTETRKKYFSTPPDICIPLDKSTAQNNCGYWPGSYRDGESFRDFYPQRCVNKNKQLVFGFESSDSLYVMQNGNLIASHLCKSKYMTERHSFPDDSLGYFSFLDRFLINEPRYKYLVYDTYRNYYYRVVHHALDYETKDGMTVNSYLDKPWSIMILDENFELLDEILMDQDRFVPGIYPAENGIFLRQRPAKGSTGPIAFTLFSFES